MEVSIRVFAYDGREFPDPDPTMAVEEVRQSMAVFFPELVTAETMEHEKDGAAVYEFIRKTGVKGWMP